MQDKGWAKKEQVLARGLERTKRKLTKKSVRKCMLAIADHPGLPLVFQTQNPGDSASESSSALESEEDST